MTEREGLAVARENIQAFCAGDWERYRVLLAPESVYFEPATGRRVVGADAIIAAIRGWREAFPDVRGTIGTAIAAARRWCWR